MRYDYDGVTQVRHDRKNKRLELVVKGRPVVVEGVSRLYVKSAPWIDADGTIHLNKGRVSLAGEEAAVGD